MDAMVAEWKERAVRSGIGEGELRLVQFNRRVDARSVELFRNRCEELSLIEGRVLDALLATWAAGDFDEALRGAGVSRKGWLSRLFG